MRALFHHSRAEWDGEARAFVLAARGLASRGWHVAFACCADTEPHRRAAALGLDVVPMRPTDGMMTTSMQLARAVREKLTEVVFVHGERAQVAAAGAVWRASRGAVVRRVPAGATLTLGRAARAALRSAATGFLCTWPEQTEKLPEGVAALGVVVADVGVDAGPEPVPPRAAEGADGTAEARRDRRLATLRRLVCVYEPGARLRAASVLRVMAMLAPRHPELRLTFVGPRAHDDELQMHAAALGVNRLLTAATPDTDVSALLADADLAWVVADGDDGAFGVLDCLAASVPVLVERGAPAARYVPDGIGGVHLHPGDVPGSAATIAQLLAHEADREAMGAAGRARVLRTYTEAAMLDGFARAATAARDRTRWRG